MNVLSKSPSELDFATLIARVRQGDQDAAELLVRHYEPIIRREIRLSLVDPRLVRLFDSIDVSQSVFASFFSRSTQGQFDLEDANQLAALLLRMARNKLASRSRDAKRQKRDFRRMVALEQHAIECLVSAEPEPCDRLSEAEQIQCIRDQLSRENTELFELRSQGVAWPEIARRVGGMPQARRVQLMRALRAARTAID